MISLSDHEMTLSDSLLECKKLIDPSASLWKPTISTQYSIQERSRHQKSYRSESYEKTGENSR